MIVRIMHEGQYSVDDSVLVKLNRLDEQAMEALSRNDEPALDRCLEEMAALVRAEGTRLDDADLSYSHVIIPPSDLTLEETRKLFAEDHGLVPDLPA